MRWKKWVNLILYYRNRCRFQQKNEVNLEEAALASMCQKLILLCSAHCIRTLNVYLKTILGRLLLAIMNLHVPIWMDYFYQEVSIPMILIDSNYSCALSKITFKSIIDSLKRESIPAMHYGEGSIAFVDGDSANIYSVVKSVYELRKSSKVVYMVTLLSKGKDCSSVIRHLSDYVVDKKITYDDLERLIRTMLATKPKVLADNVFGDVWGDILKSSQKEYLVLKLLLEGHSQYQIAKMLHLSIKTISGYKVKAIKRHGARNFNELYMLKLNNNA